MKEADANEQALLDQGYTKHRRKGVSFMRPHVPGEDMTGISVGKEDTEKLAEPGGWIAVNPKNHEDRWYVNAQYYDDNLQPEESA